MASITLSMPDADAEVFLAAIIREHPIKVVPVLDDDGNPTFDDEVPITEPECTPIQKVKQIAMAYLAKEARMGATKLRLDADPIDEDLIQNIINNNLN